MSRGATSPGFSVFTVDTDVTASISGLTIAGGNAGSGSGGGIDNSGTLTVSGSTFTTNSASDGGGMFNSGTATVSGSTFTGNFAIIRDGGGIYNSGTATVTVSDSTFTTNSAFFGGGGGIDNYGTATVSDSTFTGNSAINGYGGGIYNGGTATVSGSTFASNSAVYNSAKPPFTGYGGGIYNSGTATVTVSDSTFTGNSAHEAGGGFDNSGTATVSDSTFTSNSTLYGNGGGIWNYGTATLYNTIVAGQTGGGDVSGSYSGSNNLIGGNPLLAPLGDYGGPTQTMALLPGSPAIDAGGAVTTLSAAVDNSSPSISVTNGSVFAASSLPTLTSGYYFIIQVDNEQMAVVGLTLFANNSATLDVVRGANNTSAATHAGGASVYLGSDQRGEPRVGAVDIGAFESQGFTLTPVAGSTPQATVIGTPFAQPLAVTVTANNPVEPVQGGQVTFTAPASGPPPSWRARRQPSAPAPTARPTSRPPPTARPAHIR